MRKRRIQVRGLHPAAHVHGEDVALHAQAVVRVEVAVTLLQHLLRDGPRRAVVSLLEGLVRLDTGR